MSAYSFANSGLTPGRNWTWVLMGIDKMTLELVELATPLFVRIVHQLLTDLSAAI